jgi:beta-glucosidase/6-phospho-beta-glucosidase/beta-galactosidase
VKSLLSAGGLFGDVNPDGVAFYNAIIDALVLKGI